MGGGHRLGGRRRRRRRSRQGRGPVGRLGQLGVLWLEEVGKDYLLVLGSSEELAERTMETNIQKSSQPGFRVMATLPYIRRRTQRVEIPVKTHTEALIDGPRFWSPPGGGGGGGPGGGNVGMVRRRGVYTDDKFTRNEELLRESHGAICIYKSARPKVRCEERHPPSRFDGCDSRRPVEVMEMSMYVGSKISAFGQLIYPRDQGMLRASSANC